MRVTPNIRAPVFQSRQSLHRMTICASWFDFPT